MIQYRLATLADLDAIGKLHMDCFPNSMWHFLGEELVSAFYREYIVEDNFFVVALDEGQIIGLCMGYHIPSKAHSNFMHKNRGKLIKRVLWGVITCNALVIKKIIAYLTPHKQYSYTQADGDLLSICVHPQYRGSGVAQELLIRFENLLKQNNISEYILGAYSDNLRAITFYKQEGLKPVYESNGGIYLAKKIK